MAVDAGMREKSAVKRLFACSLDGAKLLKFDNLLRLGSCPPVVPESKKSTRRMSNSRVEMRIPCMEPYSDHERFTRLLIEHEPELLRCVLVAVPNRADARDIMQECSVAL